MPDQIYNYITTHEGDLISSIIISIIFLIIPFLITKKRISNDDMLLNRKATFKDIQIFFSQTILIRFQQKKTYTKNYRYANNDLPIYIILLLLALSFYKNYHVIIMNALSIYTLVIFLSTTLLIVLLYRNNNLDGFNKIWCITQLFLVLVNFSNIMIMSQQKIYINLQIDNLAITVKSFDYLIGFLVMCLVNIVILLIQINLFAVNAYLSKRGKISLFFVKITSRFLLMPKSTLTFLILFSILSLLLSSGKLYDLFTYLTNLSN